MKRLASSQTERSPHLALVLLVLAAPAAAAAEPPANRTYFTVAMGLDGRHAVSAHCLEFTADRVSSPDGEISGNWQQSKPRGREAALRFALSMFADGDSIEIDGQARIDTRGAGSSLAGAARARMGNAKLNFALAGREVRPSLCPDLVAGFEGDSVPDIDVVGSGIVVTESRSVSGFRTVSVRDAGRLVIERTGSESLTITAEDNILPLLESSVRNGRLDLGIRSTGDVRPTREITYRLTVRDLDGLAVSGAVEVDATDIQGDTLTVDLQGSSSLTIDGRTENQEIRVTGSAVYRANELRSRTAKVDLSGNSYAVVRVSDSIEGTATGSSLLEYIGDPEVDVQTSGTASVRRVGG